jgi:hypothetical protein
MRDQGRERTRSVVGFGEHGGCFTLLDMQAGGLGRGSNARDCFEDRPPGRGSDLYSLKYRTDLAACVGGPGPETQHILNHHRDRP